MAITQKDHQIYTELAIKSLLKTNTPCRIIVLDDCSEDANWKPPTGVDRFFRSEKTLGVIEQWNIAYRHWMESDEEYMVLANNDVIFTKDWWGFLMMGFGDEECWITGPMTNQPGHQPRQICPIDDPVKFIESAKINSRNPTRNGYKLLYVNGFCFMLWKERICPISEQQLFSTNGDMNYGGEDEYQARMRNEKHGFAFAMEDSRVFHFKDVSFESYKEGRMGLKLEELPHRLEEN